MVPPGQTRRYTFSARASGTRWDHSHDVAGPDLRRSLYSGMYGYLLVEPASGPGRFDQEVLLAAHHWEGSWVSLQDIRRGPPPDNGLEVVYASASINDKVKLIFWVRRRLAASQGNSFAPTAPSRSSPERHDIGAALRPDRRLWPPRSRRRCDVLAELILDGLASADTERVMPPASRSMCGASRSRAPDGERYDLIRLRSALRLGGAGVSSIRARYGERASVPRRADGRACGCQRGKAPRTRSRAHWGSLSGYIACASGYVACAGR
jgi:Multicopper oxidase